MIVDTKLLEGTVGNPTTELEAVAPWITEVPYPTVPALSPPSIPNPAPSVDVVKAAPVLWVAKAAPAFAPSITEVPYPTVPSLSPPSIPNPAPSAPKAVPVTWVVCVVVVK